ncbi:hypothetical protein NC652_009896 [Populus alba x Populus x berolinensis]|nr:hypothetical protein NC652_009896 [Populus alba x Populus x berolinensis]
MRKTRTMLNHKRVAKLVKRRALWKLEEALYQ